MITRISLRSLSGIAPACAIGGIAPACGSAGTAAAAQVGGNWAAFFSAKTPAPRRVSLLPDGSQFAAIIKARVGSGLAAQACARVSKVTVTSPARAQVTYSILLGGQPTRQNQSGVAVYQDGIWKVGVASFCGLLVLENNTSTASLPAADQAAS